MPPKKNITGQKFGMLTVLGPIRRKEIGGVTAILRLCKCDCGSEKYIRIGQLTSGSTKSCGCLGNRNLELGQAAFNLVLRTYKKRAKEKGYDFQLSDDQFRKLTSSKCRYCGKEPSTTSSLKSGDYIYNGIDRLDSDQGYIMDNCVPCCNTCNMAKQSLSEKDFLELIDRIYVNTNRKQIDVCKNRAVIFGCPGQDGSYLSDLLLSKNYEVIGVKRRSSNSNTERISHILDHPNFHLVEADILDAWSVSGVIEQYKPGEAYCLAAQSHVGISFNEPVITAETNALGVLNCLEAIKKYSPQTKFYNAGSSEEWGNNFSLRENEDGTYTKIQDENTQLKPVSPYGCSKVAARHFVEIYRDSYGLFACQNWLHNHESPRRGENFVTRKITKWIAEFNTWKTKYNSINLYLIDDNYIVDDYDNKFPKLRLGNIDSMRDWSHSKNYVEAMWLTLQQEKPDDYVICTGETHSVREFLDEAFSYINIYDWEKCIVIDPKFYRPNELNYLCGDYSKAKQELGWEPKISFKELVQEMVEADIERLQSPGLCGFPQEGQA